MCLHCVNDLGTVLRVMRPLTNRTFYYKCLIMVFVRDVLNGATFCARFRSVLVNNISLICYDWISYYYKIGVALNLCQRCGHALTRSLRTAFPKRSFLYKKIRFSSLIKNQLSVLQYGTIIAVMY